MAKIYIVVLASFVLLVVHASGRNVSGVDDRGDDKDQTLKMAAAPAPVANPPQGGGVEEQKNFIVGGVGGFGGMGGFVGGLFPHFGGVAGIGKFGGIGGGIGIGHGGFGGGVGAVGGIGGIGGGAGGLPFP